MAHQRPNASRSQLRIAMLASHLLQARQASEQASISAIPVHAVIGFNFRSGPEKTHYQQESRSFQSYQNSQALHPHALRNYQQSYQRQYTTDRESAQCKQKRKTEEHHHKHRCKKHCATKHAQQVQSSKLLNVTSEAEKKQAPVHVTSQENLEQIVQARESAIQAVKNGDITRVTQTYTFDQPTHIALESLQLDPREFNQHTGNKVSQTLHRELIQLAPHLASAQALANKYTQTLPLYRIAERSFLLANECKVAQAHDEGFNLLNITHTAIDLLKNHGEALVLGAGEAGYHSLVAPILNEYDTFCVHPSLFVKALPRRLGNLAVAIAKALPQSPRLLAHRLQMIGSGEDFKQWRTKLAKLSGTAFTQELARGVTQEIVLPFLTGRMAGSVAAKVLRTSVHASNTLAVEAARTANVPVGKVYDVLDSWHTADGSLVELVKLTKQNKALVTGTISSDTIKATQNQLVQKISALPAVQQPIVHALIAAATSEALHKNSLISLSRMHRFFETRTALGDSHEKIVKDFASIYDITEQVHNTPLRHVWQGVTTELTFDKLEHLCTIDAKFKDGKLVDWGGGHALDLQKIALQKNVTVNKIEHLGKGVIHATITFYGITKPKTQFPPLWDEATRLAKIQETLTNPEKHFPSKNNPNREINIGITSCGVAIQTVIDKETREIISSYPDAQRMRELYGVKQ